MMKREAVVIAIMTIATTVTSTAAIAAFGIY